MIKDRIKELTSKAESLKSSLEDIKALNDEFIGEDMIEEVLNLPDKDLSLSTSQLKDLEKTLQTCFETIAKNANKPLKSGAKEHDYCDEINDVTGTVEEIIRDLVIEVLNKQQKQLDELSEKIQDLQKCIDNAELEDLDLDIAYDLEMLDLGVKPTYEPDQAEMNRLFAADAYVKIQDNPKPKNKCLTKR